MDAESHLENIERLVHEKWPMVVKYIRATVLEKCVNFLNPRVNDGERSSTDIYYIQTRSCR